jgi:hypothetical protein
MPLSLLADVPAEAVSLRPPSVSGPGDGLTALARALIPGRWLAAIGCYLLRARFLRRYRS